MAENPSAGDVIDPMPENRIFGIYTRPDTGIEYSYAATWEESGAGASWSGKVLHPNADLAGQPGGRILSTHGLDYPTYVRVLVEQSINDLPANN